VYGSCPATLFVRDRGQFNESNAIGKPDSRAALKYSDAHTLAIVPNNFIRDFRCNGCNVSRMTIWLLAIVLLGLLAVVGYNQGAIRVAFSLVGLLVGGALAWPLSPLVRPIFPAITLTNPMWGYYLAPVVIFLVLLTVFKVIGFTVHQKAETHYKYNESETRRLMWERLMHRLGLCLGLANGAVYLLLISVVVFVLGYVSVPVATADDDPMTLKVLNRLARDLQSSGFHKSVAAFDPMPETYYDAIDIIGDIRSNPLLVSRLSKYPAFLGLAERPEFQDLGKDTQFNEMWARQARIGEIMQHAKFQEIVNNEQIRAEVLKLADDFKDLKQFIETGKSPKYDSEKILGRWQFVLTDTMALLRKTKPNMSNVEYSRSRRSYLLNMSKALLIATVDNQIILKRGGEAVPVEVSAKGTWKKVSEGNYQFTLDKSGQAVTLDATLSDNKLAVTGSNELPLAFDKDV
jgi:uncharacterized membrane protein required for colicin V production